MAGYTPANRIRCWHYPGFLLRQTPANHFTIEEFSRFSFVRPPVGIAGHQRAVVELDGVAETSTRAAVDGSSGVNHENVVLEIEFKAVFGFTAEHCTNAEGRIERALCIGEQQPSVPQAENGMKHLAVVAQVRAGLPRVAFVSGNPGFHSAELVKVEPVLMDTQTNNYTFDRKGNIDGWDDTQTWMLKLTNTRDIEVEVEITRNFGIDYWDLTPQTPTTGGVYKKHDKNHARFTLMLSPRTETSFTYTVTKYQGTRGEVYVKQLQEQQK